MVEKAVLCHYVGPPLVQRARAHNRGAPALGPCVRRALSMCAQYLAIFGADPVAVVPVSLSICIVVSLLRAVMDFCRVVYNVVQVLATRADPGAPPPRRVTPTSSRSSGR